MTDRDETYFATYRMRDPEEERPELPDGLIVRPAEMKDVAGLAVLHQERQGGLLSQHQQRYQKEVSQNPDWQQRLLLVAEVEDTLVGFGRVVYFQPPPDPPANMAPGGWHLAGVIVTPAFRRRGIGAELTRRRLEWIAQRADVAYYFVNAQNRASIALHAGFQFEEVTRDFIFPGVTFTGGVGILYRITLSPNKPHVIISG